MRKLCITKSMSVGDGKFADDWYQNIRKQQVPTIQLAEGIEKIGAEIIVFKDISGSRNPDKLANH